MGGTNPGEGSESGARVGGGAGVVKAADAIPAQPVAAGRATRVRVLVGPADGAPNFVLRRFTMDAGGGIPAHTNRVEHEQYVLRGRARITIGDAVHEVGPDDALYIPAGTTHSYEVLEAPFEFLCVVPDAPDEIRLEEGAG
ncbi:MAG TPA: cupin domain-containing protein [Longimicrobiales bacterium]